MRVRAVVVRAYVALARRAHKRVDNRLREMPIAHHHQRRQQQQQRSAVQQHPTNAQLVPAACSRRSRNGEGKLEGYNARMAASSFAYTSAVITPEGGLQWSRPRKQSKFKARVSA